MKKINIIIFFIVFILVSCGKNIKNNNNIENKDNSVRTITDMSGRKVNIPDEPKKIYAVNPVGQLFIYSLNPDKLAGWVYELSEKEKKYIEKKYWSLPVLGGNFGKGNKMNPEVIIKEAPDLIVIMGEKTEKTVEEADNMQKQLGIPVVFIEFKLMEIYRAYYFSYENLKEDRGKLLGEYSEKVIKEVENNAKSIPENKKARVFYSEGVNGLQTEPKGSYHAAVIEEIGAVNVADVNGKSKYGRVEINFEQLLLWDPDIVIVYSDYNPKKNFFDLAENNKNFSKLRAVKNKDYYETPYAPFNWFDRPPSHNQLLGLLWAGNLIYPQVYKYNIAERTKEFGRLFYNLDWSDAEVSEILKNSKRQNIVN